MEYYAKQPSGLQANYGESSGKLKHKGRIDIDEDLIRRLMG